MTQTNNLRIDLVAQSQAQKEVTINEAIGRLDALQNRGVIDKDLSSPPISPSEGDAYIVAATASGAWEDMENHIAYYNNGWRFIEPNEGLVVWLNDEDKLYFYNGTAWTSYTDSFQNLAKLGINATADNTNKLAVASEAVLITAATNSIYMKLNKVSASDTASILFQDGYSGRAEIGNIGDDDFRFKVSPDGSAWNSSIILNKTTGNADFNSGFSAGGGTVMKKILSATASLDFPNISAHSSADLTISVTGATTGSTVQLGLPASPTAGIIYMAFVSAADTVTVRAFNATGSAIDPSSQSFRVSVTTF